MFTHYLIMTTSYPGYWGRGETLADAIKAARYIKPGAEVQVFRCVADADVDGMGRVYGVDLSTHQVGKARARGKVTLAPCTCLSHHP